MSRAPDHSFEAGTTVLRHATTAKGEQNRLMVDFLLRARDATSLEAIVEDAEATAVAVRALSVVALFDCRKSMNPQSGAEDDMDVG
jgi:hypothetical protein